jgi:hypothetical protein
MTLQSKLSFAGSRPIDSSHEPGLEAGFDLPDLLRILRTRKHVIIGAAAAVVALTAIALFQMTPRYTATALVMLDQRENRLADVQAVLSGLPTDPASIENQVQILLLSRVADKLSLQSDPEFNPLLLPKNSGLLDRIDPRNWFTANAAAAIVERPAADPRNLIVDRLLTRLSATAQGRSTAIQIRQSSPMPSPTPMSRISSTRNSKPPRRRRNGWPSASRSCPAKCRSPRLRCSNTRSRTTSAKTPTAPRSRNSSSVT